MNTKENELWSNVFSEVRAAVIRGEVQLSTEELNLLFENRMELIELRATEEYRQEEKIKTKKTKAQTVLENPALVSAIANVTIALLVLNFERAGIVTSRAFSLIRPK